MPEACFQHDAMPSHRSSGSCRRHSSAMTPRGAKFTPPIMPEACRRGVATLRVDDTTGRTSTAARVMPEACFQHDAGGRDRATRRVADTPPA